MTTDSKTVLSGYQTLRVLDFTDLVQFTVEMKVMDDRDQAKSALEAWLIWLAAHRYKPGQYLPMCLPYGPVLAIHQSSILLDSREHNRICELVTGSELTTVSVIERDRGEYAKFKPIGATLDRIKEAGLPQCYQFTVWQTSHYPDSRLALFTVNKDQSDYMDGDWKKLWNLLYLARVKAQKE